MRCPPCGKKEVFVPYKTAVIKRSPISKKVLNKQTQRMESISMTEITTRT